MIADIEIGNAVDDSFDIEMAIDKKHVITQQGDLWLLGQHKLLCGDSTDMESVVRLMDGKLCDMILTDPPYNVAYKSNGMTIQNDDMKEDEFKQFLYDAFVNMWSVAKTGTPKIGRAHV